MDGADFILAINLSVAALLAAAFMTVAAFDPRQASGRWLAASYFLGMVYFGIEFAISLVEDPRPVIVAAFVAFLGATIAFNIGLARKYKVRVAAWTWIAFLIGAGIAVVLVQDWPRTSIVRMLVYQIPYAQMQLAGVVIIATSPMRLRRADKILIGLLTASAVQFLCKPFVAYVLGGPGATPQDYLQTTYALISQSTGAVFGLATALMMLLILARDALVAATEKSETDTLSGLLNRGGFEVHAGLALQDAVSRGVQVTLVIADLDYFKSINDTYGHASGDKVIAAFAGFLRSAMADYHEAGRIGGEEFAILLPGTNLIAARLFAEGARTAFSSMQITGMPEGKRFTASFGVAEHMAGESIADLLARADKALYLAKKSGRNCVKIAARPDLRVVGGAEAAIRLG